MTPPPSQHSADRQAARELKGFPAMLMASVCDRFDARAMSLGQNTNWLARLGLQSSTPDGATRHCAAIAPAIGRPTASAKSSEGPVATRQLGRDFHLTTSILNRRGAAADGILASGLELMNSTFDLHLKNNAVPGQLATNPSTMRSHLGGISSFSSAAVFARLKTATRVCVIHHPSLDSNE